MNSSSKKVISKISKGVVHNQIVDSVSLRIVLQLFFGSMCRMIQVN